MRRYLVLGILVTAFAATVQADSRQDHRVRCEKIKDRIRHVRAEMRAGYTRARGEQLAKQLRKLNKERRKTCR